MDLSGSGAGRGIDAGWLLVRGDVALVACFAGRPCYLTTSTGLWLMGGQRSGAVWVKLVQVVASQCWLLLCSVLGLWFRCASWWIVGSMVW
jgi:hypothetical protein